MPPAIILAFALATAVTTMVGGLLALRLTEPNFYLMDEPTNHVDIQGQERLEAEILAHQATCVLVSHDRFFVRAIGTRFLRIQGGWLVEQEAPGR